MTQQRRWFHTLSARFESWVQKLEHHDAVVASLAQDLKAGIRKSRVQLKRLESEVRRLETEAGTAETEALQWKSRALQLDASDDARALECVRRAQKSSRAAEARHLRAQELHGQCSRLREKIQELENAHAQVRERRQALRAREATVETARIHSGAQLDSLEEVFERWDHRVEDLEFECELSVDEPVEDAFESSFKREEEAEALSATLEAWKQASGGAQ